MGDNLHELNRKELKELCSQNNIRTAGVKHEDLVRLLRNKLYPSSPLMPRAMKGQGPKVPSLGKEDSDSYKTPVKVGRGRNFRSLTLSREDVTASARKSISGLLRKPLLAKSNTMSSQRTDLGMKTLGVDHDAQVNFVRRLCQINGMSPLRRKGMEATSGKTTSKPIHLSLVHTNDKIEELTSPKPSEGGSDAGSDASRRISEIATDAGLDNMSDLSDAEEFRSVSSEPISKLSSINKRNNSLRTESSKMSHLSAQSGLSLLAAGTSWGTNDHTKDNLSRADNTEVIFPEFPLEGSNFLVGDIDASDMSFLHAGDADPEVIVKGKDVKFDVMDSPVACEYTNYNCCSEADIKKNSIDSNRVFIGEEPRDENNGVARTSIDAKDTKSKEVGHINDEVELPKNEVALGNEGTESSQYKPHKEDIEDGPEIHSELPCLESNSPTFDLKDYSVAKKLVFEREENLSLPPPMLEGKEVNTPSSEGPVLSVLEKEDLALHSKSDEPTEAVSETPPPTIDGGEEVNIEEGPVLSVAEVEDCALHSKRDEPTMHVEAISETLSPTIQNSSSDGKEEVNVEGLVLSVLDEEDPTLHSMSDESTLNVGVFSEALPLMIEDTSFDEGEEVNVEEVPILFVPNTLDEGDFAIHSKTSKPTINDDLAETVSGSLSLNTSSDVERDITNNIDKGGSVTSVKDFEAFTKHNDESKLVDTTLSSQEMGSFETEDQDTSTVERHVDISSNSSLTKNDSDKAAPKLEGSPATELEGSDVKAGDGQSTSTSAIVVDHNKDEREKEDKQVKLSFPLSIIVWCSKLCSRRSRNRRILAS